MCESFPAVAVLIVREVEVCAAVHRLAAQRARVTWLEPGQQLGALAVVGTVVAAACAWRARVPLGCGDALAWRALERAGGVGVEQRAVAA